MLSKEEIKLIKESEDYRGAIIEEFERSTGRPIKRLQEAKRK